MGGSKNVTRVDQMQSELFAKPLNPMKVHIGGDFSCTETGTVTDAAFDASAELRRSLEQLLRLHSEQQAV